MRNDNAIQTSSDRHRRLDSLSHWSCRQRFGINLDSAPSSPCRSKLNYRLAHQNYRINREFREGEISRAQARGLHREDRFVRREERFMAAQQHGHITRIEQRSLNQQENGISRQIGN
jgi:hypothetical protein